MNFNIISNLDIETLNVMKLRHYFQKCWKSGNKHLSHFKKHEDRDKDLVESP